MSNYNFEEPLDIEGPINLEGLIFFNHLNLEGLEGFNLERLENTGLISFNYHFEELPNLEGIRTLPEIMSEKINQS